MKNRFEQKNSEITIVSRETSSRPPAHCPSSNARLNYRRKAAGFILRMFRLPEHRPRGVVSMSRSSDLQSAKAREDNEPIFDTETRVSRIPAKRSHQIKPKIPHIPPPDADKPTSRQPLLPIPHFFVKFSLPSAKGLIFGIRL